MAADHLNLLIRTDALEECSKKQTSDLSTLNEQFLNLQSELNMQLQRDRLQNLEISGLPEKKNENLISVITNIAQIAGVVLQPQDVDHITRVQQHAKTSGRPKLVIVRLRTRLLRDSIISGIRNRKGIKTSELNIPGEPQPIYVNEHLTPANKFLYMQAKKKKRASPSFRYVLVRDGKLFARKDDNSPIIHIRTIVRTSEDLDKIA
ncbi:hypothetical protein O0L34_g19259 [Tuta absoluta]|nr:hypothetical protein O0L34_g19259 [Tuta absoluta]